MTPMTFWASLVPWLYEKMAADTSCRRRNQLSTRAGACRRTSQEVITMLKVPRTMPMRGESTMKAAILAIPESTSPSCPSAGRVAPIIPPARAWDEEEGSPHHQVRRFQTMAPTSEANTTTSTASKPRAFSMSKWMTPLPMVFATWSSPPRKAGSAATKLKKAAQPTATSGASTRVETTVAMELAASWKPLRKSNASATRTRRMTTARSMAQAGSSASGVLEDHALDHVGHVLGLVRGGLDEVQDLLPLHDRERVASALEELGQGGAQQRVGLVLQRVDLAAGRQDPIGLLEIAHGPHRRRIGEVEHVVDGGEEPVDGGAVEGGDELGVESLEGPVGHVGAGVLHVLDGLHLAGDVGEVLEQFLEEARALDGLGGLLLEVVEEIVRLGHELLEHREGLRLPSRARKIPVCIRLSNESGGPRRRSPPARTFFLQAPGLPGGVAVPRADPLRSRRG